MRSWKWTGRAALLAFCFLGLWGGCHVAGCELTARNLVHLLTWEHADELRVWWALCISDGIGEWEIEELAKVRGYAVPRLRRHLRSASGLARWNCAVVLVALGDASGKDVLVEVVLDPKPATGCRLTALYNLVNTLEITDLAWIEPLLDDSSPRVLYLAGRLLWSLAGEKDKGDELIHRCYPLPDGEQAVRKALRELYEELVQSARARGQLPEGFRAMTIKPLPADEESPGVSF